MIVGTFTPDVTVPSTACLVQHQLGITAPAMDLQAACAGFVYALVTGLAIRGHRHAAAVRW